MEILKKNLYKEAYYKEKRQKNNESLEGKQKKEEIVSC